MNWKLPDQLRWIADQTRDGLEVLDPETLADILEEAAHALELARQIIVHEEIQPAIEEGDRANG
jgi:hypothetical protein